MKEDKLVRYKKPDTKSSEEKRGEQAARMAAIFRNLRAQPVHAMSQGDIEAEVEGVTPEEEDLKKLLGLS